jgi:CPA1 family monovalent cation:H+ antiporter
VSGSVPILFAPGYFFVIRIPMTLYSVFSLFTLLLISIGTAVLAKRIRVPFTVLLVVVGTLLAFLAQLEWFSFIREFELTPELLFYMFLPILIFESAYNMQIRDLQANIRSIAWLSIVSLLVSMFAIAGILYGVALLFGFQVPFLVFLLFGALISATDPVAVLAIFKEFGVPRRLSLLFEGESLFNDGTAFAAFLIVLEMLIKGYEGVSSLSQGVFMFTSMVVGGIAFGLLMGFVFSKLIGRAGRSEHIEITLTMLVAHLTFILAEVISHHLVIFGFEFKLSAIIATVMASMVIGNYGRSKLSYQTAHFMERFWGYFAFLANSLVFITMGLLFANLPIDFHKFFFPILVTVLVVVLARALSIYPVVAWLNRQQQENHIPLSWQHLLAWGSLRGALAVTMVMLIPDNLTIPGWSFDFSVKEFVTALTIGCIYFTLFVKATSIGAIIRYFKLDDLSPFESSEYHQSRAFMYDFAVNRIESFHEKGYIGDSAYEKVHAACQEERDRECHRCASMVRTSPREFEYALRVHALGIEKYFLGLLYRYHEVSEAVYKHIITKLTVQTERVEAGETQLQSLDEEFAPDWFERLASLAKYWRMKAASKEEEIRERYMYYRAQEIIARKVVKELLRFRQRALIQSDAYVLALTRVTEQYQLFWRDAQGRVEGIAKEHPEEVGRINDQFGSHSLTKALEEGLLELTRKGMLPHKIAIALEDELESKEIAV